jgi:hypothetical protein
LAAEQVLKGVVVGAAGNRLGGWPKIGAIGATKALLDNWLLQTGRNKGAAG